MHKYIESSSFKKTQKDEKSILIINENQKQNEKYSKSKQENSKSQSKSKKLEKNEISHKKSTYEE